MSATSDGHQPHDPVLRLTISPAPTAEEEGAIVASVALLMTVSAPETAGTDRRDGIDGWRLAGREAAHASSPAALERRWSRPRAWLRER